jgi:D-inositol-3-phosphate glycosyltransferase
MTTPNKQTHHNHRIAMVSIHGCPLVIPGMRFAGGMNVYLRDIAPIIAKKGVQVDIFTRNHHSGGPE